MKTVKIVNMPGEVKTFGVAEGTTVSELCNMAGIEVTNESEITGDGNKVSVSDTVDNYNMIIVTKRIKGNVTVKIVNMPGEVKEYEITSETTVEELCNMANIAITSESEITGDGNKVSLTDKAANYSMVIVTKRIKGNK